MSMTKEEMRIAIAEWMGYNPIGMERDNAYWTLIPLAQYSEFDKKDKIKHRTCILPNFSNDLNAMHKAEKKLNRNEQQIYLNYLDKLCTGNDFFDNPVVATASQRSEALCRMFWPEKFE